MGGLSHALDRQTRLAASGAASGRSRISSLRSSVAQDAQPWPHHDEASEVRHAANGQHAERRRACLFATLTASGRQSSELPATVGNGLGLVITNGGPDGPKTLTHEILVAQRLHRRRCHSAEGQHRARAASGERVKPPCASPPPCWKNLWPTGATGRFPASARRSKRARACASAVPNCPRPCDMGLPRPSGGRRGPMRNSRATPTATSAISTTSIPMRANSRRTVSSRTPNASAILELVQPANG